MPISQWNDEQIVEIWERHLIEGKSKDELCETLNISRRALERRAARMRRDGIVLHHFPSSDARIDERNLRDADFTRDEWIKLLHDLQAANPLKWITNRFFANETGYKTVGITKHFGTFEEFCRQAGMGKTRQLSVLGKQTARHVAHDKYREAGAERVNWGSDYDKPSVGRWKTMLVGSDMHDREIDPFYLRMFIETARRAQPDIIGLNGDILDLPEFGKYSVDPREWDPVGRIRFAHDNILRPLREACPEAQIDLIEGNHEYRLIRHMLDANPAMMAVLSDLHGWDVRKIFGLDEFEINYQAKGDLTAYTKGDINTEIARNWKIYYDTFLLHHFPQGRHKNMAGINGHHHSHRVWAHSNPIFGAFEWHQLGCGHVRNASYCDGENWDNGFALVHIDSHRRRSNTEYIPITDFAVIGGVHYERTREETWRVE